jgi:TetR/AcrR family transcriptional regulator
MNDQARQTRPSRAKAERTRASILDAAEHVFAEKGYAAGRLEDVAARVGIRRASLFYYFRDKRDLYDTVLTGIFAALLDRYQGVLAAPTSPPQRIEAIVDAWVGFVGERPTTAQLLLWEAADRSERTSAAVGPGAAVVAALVSAIREGQAQGCFHPIDPIHFIVTIIGATVFFVTATTRLAPEWPLAAHRVELLGISRRLLGTAGTPEPGGSRSSRPPSAAVGSPSIQCV